MTHALALQDHVFDVEVWSKTLPADEAGESIGFREYSILENPRMSQARVVSHHNSSLQLGHADSLLHPP